MESSRGDGPSPPSTRSENDISSTDGSPVTSIDLDPFLNVLETRLRSPYSSFDLVRALCQYTPLQAPPEESDSTAAGRSVGQAENLRLLQAVFNRMAKSVKLRAIVGLMGLEPQPDSKRQQEQEQPRGILDDALWKVLVSTESADVDDSEGTSGHGTNLAVEDEWVRVLSGVVRGVLFAASEGVDADGLPNSTTSEATAAGSSAIIHNAAEGIVNETCDAFNFRAGETRLNGDPSALFPQSFMLLPPTEVKKYAPDVVVNGHFTTNISANPALRCDVENESKRAEEENLKADMEDAERRQQQQRRLLTSSVGEKGGSTASSTSNVGGRGTGYGARATGKEIPDTASLFVRSKKPVASKGALAGRGMSSAPRALGGRMGARGMGRGSAAAAFGRSLGVPTRKVMPGIPKPTKKRATAFVASSGAGVQPAGGTTAASALKGRAGRAMGKSKMMMIDSTEVEALSKEHKAREEKTTFSSSAAGTGRSRKRKIMEAAAAEEAAKKSKAAVSTSIEQNSSAKAPGKGTKEEGRTGSAQQPPRSSTEALQNTDWRELLSKSNKLSDEDRSRVERFFTEKFNPTPDQNVYKMKLNEERKFDKETGLTIKETLYLELDYSTFGYKKTRKTKKK